MKYVTAVSDMADEIFHVLQTTIQAVYPKYYPMEIVNFFCEHHNKKRILKGIAEGNIGVLMDEDRIIGTGSHSGNHIASVYVLPAYQKQGGGTLIMDHLEEEIARMYPIAILEASLPTVCLYERRGYVTVGHGVFEVENDVKLVYEIMKKELK